MKRRLTKASPNAQLPIVSPQQGQYATDERKQQRRRNSWTLCIFVLLLGCTFLVFGVLSKGSGGVGSPSAKHDDLSFYIPLQRTKVNPSEWPWPAIHIVKTRFMQEQGNLTALAEARLALFKVFCLPTIRQQSTQDFLWIIKTDPNLSLLPELVAEVKDLSNVYIVASNVNFRVNEMFPGAWRDGDEPNDLAASRVYSGNRTLLETAMALEAHYPILETRLDADDGLHLQFLENVQATAIRRFKEKPELQWMYWCSRRHIEWHWVDPASSSLHAPVRNTIPRSLVNMMQGYGTLQGIQHTKLCVTPGITTGFAVGTRESSVPVFAHDELIEKIKHGTDISCGSTNSEDCLQFMESFVFEAIRSRSPTSAGMLDVQVKKSNLHQEWWVNYAFWNMLHESFGIPRPQLQWINLYLTDHIVDVARDNLMGQCTTGHSCKESAKADLERIINSRLNISKSGIDGTTT